MTTSGMSAPAPNNPAGQHRYQTIEDKRSAVYRAYVKNPHDSRLRDALVHLSTPQQIRQSAKDGIFINYSRHDELFALELALELRAARLRVWLDMLDVPQDGDWRVEVENALDHCGVMLAVSSPHANAPDLRRERQFFLTHGKIVVPVLHSGDASLIDTFVAPIDCRTNPAVGIHTLQRLLTVR